MKLKTSFFNTAALRKDVTRFAPVWGLYTVFMLMVLFLLWADESSAADFATSAPYIMQTMGVVNFGYAGICAILLFGDLFQSRMCNALHGMPLRREGWFLTHVCAGVLFCFVPNSIGAILASMILRQYCYLAFLWLGLMLCQFLFFFGVGVFSVQCAGNRLGAAACYGLINLLAVLVAFFVETFYSPVMYGVVTDWTKICRYSPVVGFSTFEYVAMQYDHIYDGARFEGFLPEQWRYVFVALAVGLVLFGAALVLYRRRQLESAGDFIAFKPAGPVFLVLYTLGVGAVLYFIADMLSTDAEYLFLLIGFALGFFTGYMLLEKKVNVFTLKKLLILGGVTLVFFFTVALTWLDPLGITRYVPELSQVQKVYLSPYVSDYYLQNKALVLTDGQDIATVLDVHEQLIENRGEDGNLCLRLRYQLKNGTQVDRKYYYEPNSQEGKVLQQFFSDFSYVTQAENAQDLVSKVTFGEFYAYTSDLPNISFDSKPTGEKKFSQSDQWVCVDPEQTDTAIRGLAEAIAADCAAGTMAQDWEFHSGVEELGSLTLCIRSQQYITEYTDIRIFADCVNTCDYLKALAASDMVAAPAA